MYTVRNNENKDTKEKMRKTFLKAFARFKRFQIIPKDSKRFQKITKYSKIFQKIPKDSKRFQKDSERFLKVFEAF